ncbi:MAG: aldo/keto reductase [Dehalococcoidia bacterium]
MLPDIRLGPTDRTFRPLGLGTWQWGDKYWAFDPAEGPRAAREAFDASVAAGITFFDTAEVYGGGKSEEILGQVHRETASDAFIATKFYPLAHLRSSSVEKSLDASLERLGVEKVGLYQVHHPFTVLRTEAMMGRLADAVRSGKVEYVGVSNYRQRQLRAAHRALAKRGIPLVSNQVHYSLMHRAPETDGVLQACRELDITLIAYSPLAQGALTGKYGPGRGNVAGMRRFRAVFRGLKKAMPLVEALEEIGRAHDRTAAQVALNWLAAQPGVMPIPGAKNARQATENARSIDFTLTPEETKRLDRLSRRYRKHGPPLIGM